MSIHINWTRYSRINLSRSHCPTCKKRKFFVAFFQDYYGWDETCLGCGDGWQDGAMKERPFERAWRKRRIKEAKATYRKWSERLIEQPRNEGDV